MKATSRFGCFCAGATTIEPTTGLLNTRDSLQLRRLHPTVHVQLGLKEFQSCSRFPSIIDRAEPLNSPPWRLMFGHVFSKRRCISFFNTCIKVHQIFLLVIPVVMFKGYERRRIAQQEKEERKTSLGLLWNYLQIAAKRFGCVSGVVGL